MQLLDQPMHASTEEEAFRIYREVTEKLPDEDRASFDQAFTYFSVEFSQHISKDLTEQERKKAFIAAFDGITPRQVIVFGMVVRMELLKQSDPYTLELQGEERRRREEHMNEHVAGHEGATVQALRRYGK